jgi:hypothetical protein
MTSKLKKALLATTVAAALGTPVAALAAAGVWFDINGAGGANAVGVDRFFIKSFDWNAGNTLATDTTPVALSDDTHILSQSTLSVVNKQGGGAESPDSGTEITYQMKVSATPAVNDDGIVWSNGAGVDGDGNPIFDTTSFFDIFFDAAEDSLGTESTSGCGFGPHSTGVASCVADGSVLVLHGIVRLVSMNYDPSGTAAELLDQHDADNQNGVTTFDANGSGLFEIDVVSFNSDFFFDGGIDTVDIELDFNNQNPTPFTSANPTDVVVDRNVGSGLAARRAAYGFDLVNDVGEESCADVNGDFGNTNCDLHMQADANSSVLVENQVPEPGTLALLGLSFAGLGLASRRRKI